MRPVPSDPCPDQVPHKDNPQCLLRISFLFTRAHDPRPRPRLRQLLPPITNETQVQRGHPIRPGKLAIISTELVRIRRRHHPLVHLCDSIIAPKSEDTIVTSTTTLAQWWENLLHSSGGKLELSKCFYYTFHWTFDQAGTASFSRKTAFTRQVSMTDSVTGLPTLIEHEDCSQSHKTLGKIENPSGNYDDESARIREKADGFGHHVLASGLTQPQAHRLYTSMFLPSLCYGFASGTLSIAQAERAQSFFISALLPKLGYNRNIPRAVALANQRWGGIGLRHFFSEQGTKQVETLLRHTRSQLKLGTALTIQLIWAQQISGLSTPILVNTAPRLPHLSDERWISTVQLFLLKSDLSFHLSAITPTAPRRIHDTCIMDIATHLKDLSQNSIILINRCRIHLKAMFISDLADGSGTVLTNNAKLCIPDRKTVTTLWPSQPRPTNQKPWKKFLRKICSQKSGTLDQPLGQWLLDTFSREWLTYYNHVDNSTTYRISNKWMTTFTDHQQANRLIQHIKGHSKNYAAHQHLCLLHKDKSNTSATSSHPADNLRAWQGTGPEKRQPYYR